MRDVIVLFGMKRSGNHAVANWIRSAGRVAFVNNIVPIGAILRGERSLPEPAPVKDWLRWREPLPGWNRIRFLNKRVVLFSVEDHPLEVQPIRDLPASSRRILLVRDPYNLFASRIRKAFRVNNPAYARTLGPAMDRAIGVWKQHAREWLGETRQLTNCVPIYFNAWFASEAYRQMLARKLNLNLPAQRVTKVAAHGGGSSFDQLSFQGAGDKMNILNRVDQLDDHERELLAPILADREIQQLHEQIDTCWQMTLAKTGRQRGTHEATT